MQLKLLTIIFVICSVSLTGCQSVSTTDTSTQTQQEQNNPDWLVTAQKASSPQEFSVGLFHLIRSGAKKDFEQLLASAESFRHSPTKLNNLINNNFMPDIGRNWVLHNSQLDPFRSTLTVTYLVTDEDSNLYWIAMDIKPDSSGRYFIHQLKNVQLQQTYQQYLKTLSEIHTEAQKAGKRNKRSKKIKSQEQIYTELALAAKDGYEALTDFLKEMQISPNHSLTYGFLLSQLDYLALTLEKTDLTVELNALPDIEQGNFPLLDFRLALINNPFEIEKNMLETVSGILGDRAWAYYYQAYHLYARSELDLAEELLKDAIKENPQFEDSYFLLMNLYGKRNQHQEVFNLTRLMEHRFYTIFYPNFFEENEDFNDYVSSDFYRDWKKNKRS